MIVIISVKNIVFESRRKMIHVGFMRGQLKAGDGVSFWIFMKRHVMLVL